MRGKYVQIAKEYDLYVLAAIDGSIRKWKGIVHHNQSDHGVDDCPLCNLFNSSNNVKTNCIGCPIYKHYLNKYCAKTPYIKYRRYIETCIKICKELGMKKDYRLTKSLANKELTFLYEVRLDFVRRMIHDRK